MTAFGQTARSDAPVGDERLSIAVNKFDVGQGVDFPDASMDVMMTEIVDELTKLKKFSEAKLALPGDPTNTDKTEGKPKTDMPSTTIEPAVEKQSQLLLSGTVTKYQAGNRTARYLIGFGAGKAKIVAAIKVIERATGKILLEKNVDGKVIMGLFGGDSNGATRGLAKEVASVTRKAFFKK